MAETTVAIIDALDEVIEERLVPEVQDTLLKIEPIFDIVPVTSASVTLHDNGVSRDWAVRHTFMTGMSGQLSWANPYADTLSRGDGVLGELANVALPSGVNSTWPDPTKIGLRNTFQRIIPMAKGWGNLVMPLEIFQADELTAGLISMVEANLKGSAHNFALQEAAGLFQKNSGYIGTVGATITHGAGGENYVTCNLTAGRPAVFEDGLKVDLIDVTDNSLLNSSDGTYANRIPCFVDGVDPLAKTILFRLGENGATWNAQVAEGDQIVYADSWDDTNNKAWRPPMGFDDWIQKTGSIFELGQYANYATVTGIDVDVHKKFKSKVETAVGVLDEETLCGYIGDFSDAYGIPLDTIISTRGIVNKYYEQPTADSGRSVYDRTNDVLRFMSGRAKIGFSFEGQDFSWFQSRLCWQGTLLVIQRAGNLRQYMPPAIPGVSGGPANFGNSIKFMGKVIGYPNDWIPVLNSSGQPLPLKQAPCNVFRQVLPQVPQSIKLEDVTEA